MKENQSTVARSPPKLEIYRTQNQLKQKQFIERKYHENYVHK